MAKADNGTEELSVERALRAMRRADVVAIVIDAMLGATEQDYRIAERAALNGCAMVRTEQLGSLGSHSGVTVPQ